MKFQFILVVILVCHIVFTLTSCGESKKERMQREKIDSLENANFQRKVDYENLQGYLGVIAEGLDSIRLEEGELLLNTGDPENRSLNRMRMQNNLAHVRDILARHRSRIDELENQLNTDNQVNKQLRTIIVALREQLDAKDRELAQLKIDLANNKKNISQLTEQIKNLGDEKEAQTQTINQQQEQIAEQIAKNSIAYVKVGTKSELKNAGLTTGGFLKKKKVDYSNINVSNFRQIDIRTFTTLSLPNKVKILTPVPTDSYRLENSGNQTTLVITDTAKFWSVSKYLIIQTD
ncbi:hypothetical protein [Bacteroides sp.]|uniref:Cbp1 family collagen-binding glycoprotein adhesin n=1 Tax=Bacteroides sp. TaxID=29523 RepID=UPI0023D225AA|nr:hypothetical protein [Bacteroides sp.]MDE6216965.1 hypothetical protein [Bacteroides sp.]